MTGEALQAYFRLSEEAAVNYAELKNALIKRYDFTEEGYLKKFRQCKPEVYSLGTVYLRGEDLLREWIELSMAEQTYQMKV